jgi:hypothetical protein
LVVATGGLSILQLQARWDVDRFLEPGTAFREVISDDSGRVVGNSEVQTPAKAALLNFRVARHSSTDNG